MLASNFPPPHVYWGFAALVAGLLCLPGIAGWLLIRFSGWGAGGIALGILSTGLAGAVFGVLLFPGGDFLDVSCLAWPLYVPLVFGPGLWLWVAYQRLPGENNPRSPKRPGF